MNQEVPIPNNNVIKAKKQHALKHAIANSFNLNFRLTGLNKDIKMFVGQKYYSSSQDPKVLVSCFCDHMVMSVEVNPQVLIGEKNKFTTEDYNQIIKWIALNHNVLTKYWYDEITPPMLFDGLQKI